jgi:hypothetical protein
MEAQLLAEYPHQGADKRPRKRARLAWDVPPTLYQPPKVSCSRCLPPWSVPRRGVAVLFLARLDLVKVSIGLETMVSIRRGAREIGDPRCGFRRPWRGFGELA